MVDKGRLERSRSFARVIKAMAHPVRLLVVEELARHRRCVRELTELVGYDISTVSKHLSVLKNAGIVTDTKKGLRVFYSLKVPCILSFFSCVESVMRTSARELARRARE